ncbi:MAG: hypothetical protein VKP72_10330 [bacterium]|nr:hypothetical protein [bacterium]
MKRSVRLGLPMLALALSMGCEAENLAGLDTANLPTTGSSSSPTGRGGLSGGITGGQATPSVTPVPGASQVPGSGPSTSDGSGSGQGNGGDSTGSQDGSGSSGGAGNGGTDPGTGGTGSGSGGSGTGDTNSGGTGTATPTPIQTPFVLDVDEFTQVFKSKALELGAMPADGEVFPPLRPTSLDVEAKVNVSAPGPSTAFRLRGFDQTLLLASGTQLTTREKSGSTLVWVESVGLASNGQPASRSFSVKVWDQSDLTFSFDGLTDDVRELVLKLGTTTRTFSVNSGSIDSFEARDLTFEGLTPGEYAMEARAKKGIGRPDIVVTRTVTVRRNVIQGENVSMVQQVPFNVVELGSHADWAGREVVVTCEGVAADATITVGGTPVTVSRRENGASPGQVNLYFVVPSTLVGGTVQVTSGGVTLSPPSPDFRRIKRISLSPETLTISAGGTHDFTLKAFDASNLEITPFPGNKVAIMVLEGANPNSVSSGNVRIGNFGTSGKYTARTAGQDVILVGKSVGPRPESELVATDELAIARVTVQ